MRYRVGGVA